MAEATHLRVIDDALKRWRMSGPVVMEGELWKLNEKLGVTHLRHFVLYEHVLIYRHPKNRRILGVIPVEILRFCGFRKDDQTRCCFHLILRGTSHISGKSTIKEGKNTFNLQARNPTEAASWVAKLKQLQLRYEKTESALDRRGRYWLKLGKQASHALDGQLAHDHPQDSGSEWEVADDEEDGSTGFRVEKQKPKTANQTDAITVLEGYLRKRLRAAEVKNFAVGRFSRSKSVITPEANRGDERSWVDRYFTLTDKELYYGLEQAGPLVGILPLAVIEAVHFRAGSNVVFEVIVKGELRGHTFELQTTGPELALTWVKTLSTYVKPNIPVDFDIKGMFWLTLAASRRSHALDAAISSEECEEVQAEPTEIDEEAVLLSQSGRRSSKTALSPFASYWTQSSQGFVLGMEKPNQDNYANVRTFGGPDAAWFGVFDGHGPKGHLVSAFLRQTLPALVLSFVDTNITTLQALQEIPQAYASAYFACNARLNTSLEGQLGFSGSTAVACHLQRVEDRLYLWSCNVGDSRAVLAKQAGDEFFLAVPLSCDHLPTCPAEQKRIESAGGRVGPSQYGKGISRVWLKDEDVPGLAVSRAFGDAIAAQIGVVAEPEVWFRTITSNDCFIILASDGLWEFMSCQEAVDVVAESFEANGERNAEKAAKLLVSAAELRWAEEEAESRDDITVTVVFL